MIGRHEYIMCVRVFTKLVFSHSSPELRHVYSTRRIISVEYLSSKWIVAMSYDYLEENSRSACLTGRNITLQTISLLKKSGCPRKIFRDLLYKIITLYRWRDERKCYEKLPCYGWKYYIKDYNKACIILNNELKDCSTNYTHYNRLSVSPS